MAEREYEDEWRGLEKAANAVAALFPEVWEERKAIPYGDGKVIFCGRLEANKTILRYDWRTHGIDERVNYFLAAQPRNIMRLIAAVRSAYLALDLEVQMREAANAAYREAIAQRDEARKAQVRAEAKWLEYSDKLREAEARLAAAADFKLGEDELHEMFDEWWLSSQPFGKEMSEAEKCWYAWQALLARLLSLPSEPRRAPEDNGR